MSESRKLKNNGKLTDSRIFQELLTDKWEREREKNEICSTFIPPNQSRCARKGEFLTSLSAQTEIAKRATRPRTHLTPTMSTKYLQ